MSVRSKTHPIRQTRRTFRRRGMVLVVVLALIVLITVVAVAFFAHVTANRSIETSRLNRTEADLLARTAGEYVTGLFLQEIQDAANSLSDTNSGIVRYFPKARTNAVPARHVPPEIPATTNFFSLIRQSAPSVDPCASEHNTALLSRNRRQIGVSRWNAPQLLPAPGFTSADQLPSWIYVSRTDGLTNAASTNSIGRFAYQVYDIGGLLNANAAGYPPGLTGANVNALKGSQAGADLSVLNVPNADISALLDFRHPALSSGTPYPQVVAAATRAGLMSLVTTSALPPGEVYTNRYFHSRQDLIRYATARNPGFQGALPFLTHFSRALTAPSWSPATPSAVNPRIPFSALPSAGNIPHYRDDGTLEPPRSAEAGEPLITRRFSLAKLAWLSPAGPNPAAFASSLSAEEREAAILACFGLKWNSAQERWDYYGSDGAADVQLSIKTLAEVAARQREPNFFEVLKAGLLTGSLGQYAAQTTLAGANNQTYNESIKDLQILRIGASIVDQADSDNYPTIIALDGNLEVAGVEDLPYFYQVAMVAPRQTNTAVAPNKLTAADMIWVPVFFNPHSPSSPAAGESPASVEVNIARGTLTEVKASSNTELVRTMNKSLSALPAIVLPSSTFEGFRAMPSAASDASAANRFGALVPYATANTNVQVFSLYSYQAESPAGTWPADRPVSSAAIFRVTVNDLVIRLQYRTKTDQLKTYATFAGNENITGSGCMGTVGFGPSFASAARLQHSSLTLCYFASLWDPRTNRLGPSLGNFRSITDPPTWTNTNDRIQDLTPFPYTNSAAAPIFPALWPQGGKGESSVAGYFINFADPDGTFRPADAWLADSANLYRDLSSTGYARRPVILQRPFQSVGELGYVFRDSPWKTLSFFDETSGDSALLDLFSVVDEPAVSAGRVSLQSRHPAVLQSLLQGTAQDAAGSSPLTDPVGLGQQWQNYAFASGQPTTNVPQNVSDLALFLSSGHASAGLDDIKYHREAVVRALASATQTRTWNLLIDIIAQSGRFVGGTAGDNFVVEGEKRYWLSIAIDRYTGQVVDQQWESVYE
jgi:hypothetical protein